jgi:hypothetical protein
MSHITKSSKKNKYIYKNSKNGSFNKLVNLIKDTFLKSMTEYFYDPYIFDFDLITTIDDINVNVKILYFKKYEYISLNIFHNSILLNNVRTERDGSSNIKLFDYVLLNGVSYINNFNINIILKKFFDIINNLKFSKLSGNFTYSNDVLTDKNNIILSCFFEMNLNSNIKLNYDTCCVCSEKTLTKTHCKHSLCISCWSSLKNVVCPLCRNDIHYMDKVQTYEHNEDNEENEDNEDNEDDEDYEENENMSNDEYNEIYNLIDININNNIIDMNNNLIDINANNN